MMHLIEHLMRMNFMKWTFCFQSAAPILPLLSSRFLMVAMYWIRYSNIFAWTMILCLYHVSLEIDICWYTSTQTILLNSQTSHLFLHLKHNKKKWKFNFFPNWEDITCPTQSVNTTVYFVKEFNFFLPIRTHLNKHLYSFSSDL